MDAMRLEAKENNVTTSPRISIIFPYYDNPEMLRFQCGRLSSYSPEALRACEIILVDDCSANFPAALIAAEFALDNVRVFRITLDKPWNQDAARNIGAHEARGVYLLLTDIDHVVPESTVLDLARINDESRVYTLGRKAHFSDKVVPSHVNSYFMSKSLYWSIGGYDEEYWGTYGSDRLFRTRVLRHSELKEIPDVRLELVTRGSISDAKNIVFSRRPSPWRRLRSLLLRLLKKVGLRRSPVVLTNPYTQHYPA